MVRLADFSSATRKIIAERAGYQCSVLNCGRLTVGPGSGGSQVLNAGMAAHIYAASPGGPRGTGGLSATERSEPENGIWCCYFHGKAIDSEAGNSFSAAQLKAWKRLHEARKSAELIGAPQDRFGLVESISVNSAPASLAGRKFDLAMRNIITGPNASGKTVLARLIASVAFPDYVADISRRRNVDIDVRWFDPFSHHVATSGRSGSVSHILDGRPVPYVARPYKTIMFNGHMRSGYLTSLIDLSHMFDLSSSAMEATLNMLAESSELVREVVVSDGRIEWVVDIDGRSVRSTEGCVPGRAAESLILLELAAAHARHHAYVEPTILILDELFSILHSAGRVEALARLQSSAGHAQVAVIGHSEGVVDSAFSEWTRTTLEPPRRDGFFAGDAPIDFEIETTTTPPNAFGKEEG